MQIGLLNYGASNLGSIRSALRQLHLNFIDVSRPEDISKVDHLIIPGVGSFQSGIQNLTHSGMSEEVLNFAKSGRSLLGICLGMHLLATFGEEGGGASGLDLISGHVVKLPKTKNNRVPHVGWDLLTNQKNQKQDFAYFAHSYYFEVSPNENCKMTFTFDWEGKSIPAVIEKGNIVGIQFHPEKSNIFGLQLLSNQLKQK